MDFTVCIEGKSQNNGQSASWTVENEISKEEANKAMQSERDAYEVIVKAQKRGDTKRVSTN